MKKLFLFFISTIFLTSFIIPNSFAHRINVYCWVEGKKVKCESSFTPGGPVKNGKITVMCENTKEVLINGVTDNKGKFEFDLPEDIKKKKWTLKVTCTASMGHKNFWIIRPEDYLEEEGLDNSKEQKNMDKTLNAESLNEQVIKKVLLEVLSKELDPIKRDLAKMNQKKISLNDIIAGLGYILGFMGIVLYFKSREKKS